MARQPRATADAPAEQLGLSRNTVQARIARFERTGGLGSFARRITPRSLGHPLTAFVTATMDQRQLADVAGGWP
ncbi:Lrp/AsnC family transcriptional regulator [Streptomyces sp. bgisy031]|uniref:Lrp/AsnC family transcriptional regulator n=1 Tax=Streptomyces sp. bgisy031 TaxID=3413772 RepID=UPI003D712037